MRLDLLGVLGVHVDTEAEQSSVEMMMDLAISTDVRGVVAVDVVIVAETGWTDDR